MTKQTHTKLIEENLKIKINPCPYCHKHTITVADMQAYCYSCNTTGPSIPSLAESEKDRARDTLIGWNKMVSRPRDCRIYALSLALVVCALVLALT